MSDLIEKLFQYAPHLADGATHSQDHVMICCPFHGESTPSLSIATFKPVFICFACKTSGHIAQLFRIAGVPRAVLDVLLPKTDYDREKKSIKGKMRNGIDPFKGKHVLNEAILDYYRLAPMELVRNGYAYETLQHFEVGFDNQNMRITYPLRTANGDLVGISGRTVLGVEPRYKVYDRELKEREDFRVPDSYSMEEAKSAVLWHAHVIRPFFFKKNSGKNDITITEGFKACMWTWQAGIEDTVALVGSYLTPVHAELIARATRKVTLFLDNNEAGWKGTRRAGHALLKKGVEVCVAKYPDQREQPDDLSYDEIAYAVIDQVSFPEWLRTHPEYETPQQLLKKYRKAEYSP